MEFQRTVNGRGFHDETKMIIDENDIVIIKHDHKSNGSGTHLIVKGQIILKNPQYLLTKITEIDNQESEAYLDIYILGDKNEPDDAIGVTFLCDLPSYNKYFDCVIYVNKHIICDLYIGCDKEKIDRLDNIKLSSSKLNEIGRWDWKFDKETNKIGLVFK